MTVLDKVEEVSFDEKQKAQILLLMRLSFAAGLGNGVALGMTEGLFVPPPEYLKEEFFSWASTMPWFKLPGL